MTRKQVASLICDRLGDPGLIDSQASFLVVSPASQTLDFFPANDMPSKRYQVSTARNGLGNQQDSLRTPVGVHRIAEKIGDGEACGMVFRGRKPTGELANHMDNQGEDQITSRILWLEGLEAGFNRGDDRDSYQRYIYIHGTSDEQRIGQAVSAGCIRMRNEDVIDLFDRVEAGAMVLILDDKNAQ